jgi:hypothetical protein
MSFKVDPFTGDQERTFNNRLTGVEAFFRANRDIGQAVKLYDVMRQQRQLPPVSDPYSFIHYNVDKLERTYTLLNVSEHPHPKKVPDADVQRAADILAWGYEQQLWIQVEGVWYEWYEPRHFTSLKQACEYSPTLRSIMTQYDVSGRHLLQRIHEVAPGLYYSALPMKIQLSDANMAARMDYAEWMYQLHCADANFLYKILWGDETRIYIGSDLQGKLKVYHYTGDYYGQPPITNPLLNKENTIRLDVSLWVDAQHGLAHVELLTGTTNLDAESRLHLPMRVHCRDREQRGLGPYEVS